MEAKEAGGVQENARARSWSWIPWWGSSWSGRHHGKLQRLPQVPGVQEEDAHDEPDEPDRWPGVGPELLRQQLPAERVHVWLPGKLSLRVGLL